MKITIALVLITCNVAAPSQARSNRYVLQKHIITNDSQQLRLYDRQARRTVWTLTVLNFDTYAWSPNRQALAASVYMAGNRNLLQILSWRAGKAPTFSYPKTKSSINTKSNPSDYEEDGVLNIVWSPDNRHAAFRSWASGGHDLNSGALFILDTNSGKITGVAHGVRKMRWIGPHRLRYWNAIIAHDAADNPLRLVTSQQYHDRLFK